jgi:hypothetical protein
MYPENVVSGNYKIHPYSHKTYVGTEPEILILPDQIMVRCSSLVIFSQ